ncbi:uncharacterized protein IWZ02DRAFT_103825 [Phyllosticta citriasiana]|uniref:Uncharacterized protein n=1 Tax=Phyllosticta citriasiana TaxID=595635 RepID=A0ABR1KFS4_9PEZI
MDPTLYFLPLALFMRPFLRLSGIEAFCRTHQTKAADRTFFAVVRRLMSSAAAVGTAPGPFSSPHHHHPRHDATRCTSPQDDSPSRLLSAWLGLVRFLARTSPPRDSSRPPPTPTRGSMPAGSRSIASPRLASPHRTDPSFSSTRLVSSSTPRHTPDTSNLPQPNGRTNGRVVKAPATAPATANARTQVQTERATRGPTAAPVAAPTGVDQGPWVVCACVRAYVRAVDPSHPTAPRTAPGMRLGFGSVGWWGSWDEWVFCFRLVGEVLGAWLDMGRVDVWEFG